MLAALPVSAETILIALLETVDGSPSVPPLPARDGILQVFFDRGDIVFDVPDSAPIPSPEELLKLARAGGAAYALQIEVAFKQESIAQGGIRYIADAAYILTSVESGIRLGEGRIRESGPQRKSLGLAIGRLIAEEVGAYFKEPYTSVL